MKLVTVQIQLDEEKLIAIRKYSKADKPTLEQELTDAAQKVFQRRVPVAVREYIEERTTFSSSQPSKPKQKSQGDATVPSDSSPANPAQP